MNLIASFSGLITADLTGADIPGTLRLASDSGIILLQSVYQDDLRVVVTVRRRDYVKLRSICQKRGDVLKIRERTGAYWRYRAWLHRPMLIFGLFVFLWMTFYIPSRILFVRVEGNSAVPTRLILDRAGACGIGFGSSRRAVRSEKVKNRLLETMPELQWAGVNTYGCVAVISVRERAEQEKMTDSSSAFGHITARMDGVILSCTATRGNLLCAPGQAVAEGEILISGYTDTGLCIRAEQAQGEIYGLTQRGLSVVSVQNSRTVRKNGGQMKKISLILGKKRINLWKDSGIWDTTCDRMYEEYYITLPGGFRLPVALAVERFSFRACSETEIPHAELEVLLSETAQQYLKAKMLAGVIRDAEETFQRRSGIVQMAGKYDCVELIGIMQRLQIGEQNGEDN